MSGGAGFSRENATFRTATGDSGVRLTGVGATCAIREQGSKGRERQSFMIEIKNIRGRWPERRIPLQGIDMQTQILEWEGGRVWLRLENNLCPAFWLELDLVVTEEKTTEVSEGEVKASDRHEHLA
jgi:hypothetical protein